MQSNDHLVDLEKCSLFLDLVARTGFDTAEIWPFKIQKSVKFGQNRSLEIESFSLVADVFFSFVASILESRSALATSLLVMLSRLLN